MKVQELKLTAISRAYKKSLKELRAHALAENEFEKLIRETLVPAATDCLREMEVLKAGDDFESAYQKADISFANALRGSFMELSAFIETKDSSHVAKFKDMESKILSSSEAVERAKKELP